MDNSQLSFDEQAALAAEQMLKGGPAGDMPEGQPGAEGGFTETAGGQVITAGAQKGTVNKAAKTGVAMNSEPGPQHQNPKACADITNEPKASDGGGAGTGGNLSQDEDEMMRKRKAGQVGVSGGTTGGGNLSENEDAALRRNMAGKVGISKAKKADMEIEVEEDEEEEEEEKGGYKKSDLAADDLIKAMQTLEAVAGGESVAAPPDRRQELGEKLSKGMISPAEMLELSEILESSLEPMQKSEAGELEDFSTDVEEVQKSYQETFAEDETLAEGYDVSPFLEQQNQLIAAALDQTREQMVKSVQASAQRAAQFNVQLAKSLTAQAHVIKRQESLIKSLAGRLEAVENQPMPRKGISGAQQLHKSMPNEVGGAQELNREQVLDSLDRLALRGEMAPCGEKLDQAVALFEHSGQITKSLMNDVMNEIRGQ